MKGLFKKDLYMARAYCKTFVFIALFFLIFSFFVDDNLFFLVYPMVIVAMLPVNLLSYDEKFKWSRYCDAMPLTRSQVVTEKYLFTLLFSGLTLLLLGGVRGGLLLIQGEAAAFFQLLTLLFLFALISPSLLLPFIFRWGPEKGRLVYYCMIGMFCAVCLTLVNRPLTETGGFGARPLDTLLVLLVCLLLFAASWRLSIRLYKTREL